MREASSENTEQPQSLAPRTEEAEKAVSPGGPKEALRVLEGQEVESEQLTDFPQPPEPKTKQDNTLTQTILEWPDTPTKLEALDTLPTPMGGFGSLRMPRTATGTTSSSGTYVAAPSIDGLRSNPPTESDKKLSRAISAPVRHSTSRRVMIRPTDLVIGRTSNNHKLFRESIVSTPYPAIGDISEKETKLSSPPSKSLRRARPLFHHAEAETNEKSSNETAQAPEIPLSTKPVIVAAPTPAKSDRFPSPVAPEVLFLDLRLARHPAARVTVEIEVADKTTFDDEQLFTLIRASYNRKLLGVARRLFSARSLSHASMTVEDAESQRLSSYWHGTAAGPGEIDGADFIKHLLRPRCGRRRKMWLLWLRNAQCHESSASRSRRSRMAMALGSSNGVSPDTQHSPVFSFMQTSTHAHSRNNSDSTPVSATASAGRPGSGSGSGSVRIPRMPFQPFRSSTTTTARSRVSLTAAATGPPAVYLHYTFSLWKIVALLALTFFLALFTTAMWILFGLPGRGADQGNGMTVVDGNAYTLSWKRDAQSRVGVGLVMGIVVLGLGLVTEAVWVWASWILV